MTALAARTVPEGFRGPTVCRLIGITYRQLDYWARTGLVTPSIRQAEGSGSQRLYGFRDLVELRIIKRLLDAGVSLQRIREAIAYLRADDGRLSDLTLISDGNRIYACRSGEEVVDVLSHGQAVFGIAVGRVVADTEGDVARLPAAEAAPADPVGQLEHGLVDPDPTPGSPGSVDRPALAAAGGSVRPAAPVRPARRRRPAR